MINPSHHTAYSARTLPGAATLASALALGLALALPVAPALAIGEPIPGIDIVVKKNPGPIPFTIPSDASGGFALRLTEAGNYTISTACRQECPAHTISVTSLSTSGSGNAPIIAILIGLRTPSAEAHIPVSANFAVDQRGAVLSGQFHDANGVRVAVGDWNGDGVAEQRTGGDATRTIYIKMEAPQPDSNAFKVADNESPRPVDRLAAQPGNTDAQPGISDQAAAGGLVSYATAPPPKGGSGDGPASIRGGFIIPAIAVVAIRGGPGNVETSTKVEENGSYRFDKLPAGKYILTMTGQPEKPVNVGPGGTITGRVVRGSDGNPVMLVISGNVGSGAKPAIPAGFGPMGFGSNATIPGSGFGSGPAGGLNQGGIFAPGGVMGGGAMMGGGGGAMSPGGKP